MFEFGILGPMLIRHRGESIDLSASMLKRFLALLLIRPGEPVPVKALADAMWCGNPPPSARKSLHVYAHRLRRGLGNEDLINFGRGGYSLDVTAAEIDFVTFQRLSDQARAFDQLDEALRLWRGEAYSDFADLEAVSAERVRLAELRLDVQEQRFAAGLDLGMQDRLLPELRSGVLAHPFREVMRGQLMLALYRTGRQAEALEVFRQARVLLRSELGVEPAPHLQQLHQRILRGDPALAGPGQAVPVAAPNAPRILPRDVPDFTGRSADLDWLDAMARTPAGRPVLITAVEGMAGVGKTALAVHWAHHAAGRLPRRPALRQSARL